MGSLRGSRRPVFGLLVSMVDQWVSGFFLAKNLTWGIMRYGGRRGNDNWIVDK